MNSNDTKNALSAFEAIETPFGPAFARATSRDRCQVEFPSDAPIIVNGIAIHGSLTIGPPRAHWNTCLDVSTFLFRCDRAFEEPTVNATSKIRKWAEDWAAEWLAAHAIAGIDAEIEAAQSNVGYAQKDVDKALDALAAAQAKLEALKTERAAALEKSR